jgi:hypothetical protein
MGVWSRWRTWCDSLEAKQKARAEEKHRRQQEREHQKYLAERRREEYDDYGRAKRRVIVTDIQTPLGSLVAVGFVLGFSAAFGWLFARYLLSLIAQLR